MLQILLLKEMKFIVCLKKVLSLKKLDISYNKFVVCPPRECFTMPQLTYLNISHCAITEISSKIKELVNLTDLNVSYNQIESISPKIGRVSSLTSLNISFNKIHKLPPELGDELHLKIFEFSGNPLSSLPQKVSSGNLHDLREYHKQKTKEGHEGCIIA